MPRTVPCLWFDGQAEQAAELYTSVFTDSKILSVSRYGPDMPMPEGTVLTVNFSLDGQEYLALNGGPEYHFTPAISFQIMCADQAEVDHYWDELTADGGEPGPCGWLTDRFGVSWQVVPTALTELMADPDPERAGRATQAMMRMSKIDIAELRRAADSA
jgi:predicted 3-demethylubiquinone-9 3-methyltransferase (glyoxalase superfamily)